ncbi:hypothetical protein DICVIV_13874 [Dictyocaulus viviparus]|uniref:Uncharacterized protein n=1 Tax=Dictyocaulus viviparus TaxID=29172 RepID=A0A0D8X8X5_DICVI|nr:hypothetical protein DICVIV_13874 [Dictyocaulus viviparus]
MLHPAERPGRRRGTGAVPPEKITVPNTFTPKESTLLPGILRFCYINSLEYAVVKAWAVDCLVSKEEWSQWLVKLRIAFIKGPLPIAYDRLGKSAEETKEYAKALRYKELQIHKHFDRGGVGLTTEDCQALIT